MSKKKEKYTMCASMQRKIIQIGLYPIRLYGVKLTLLLQ